MKLFGLKIARYREWAQVMRHHRQRVGWCEWFRLGADMILIMVRRAFSDSLRVSWRRKIRTCYHCPVFDPLVRQCWKEEGRHSWGCGCYVPIKAVMQDDCWGDEANIGHGWSTCFLVAR